MLARGTWRRLQELELTLPESEGDAVPSAAEQLFRSVPRNPSPGRPPITKLTISLRLLTPEAARAAEAALPGLEELNVLCDGVDGRVDGSLDFKAWERPTNLQQVARQQQAALGLAVLLGPSRAPRAGSRAEEAGGSAGGAAQAPLLPALRRLELGPNLNELPQALAAALGAATQLRSLRLHLDLSLDGAIPSLSRLSGMTQLDTLELASMNASRPAGLRFNPQQVASLGAALAPLGGTLRALAISFGRCDVINAKCFTALRGLQELTLGGAVVLASSLSSLTSLTRLHAGGVGRTASQVEAGARFGLPPQLRALRLSRAQAVEDLAALEPPSSLTEVAVGLQAPGDGGIGVVRLWLALPTSADADSRLSPAGEEALCRAAALVSAPHAPMLDVGWRNGSGPVPLLLPPPEPAPGSEGHGRWLSALGSRGLRRLGLGGFALSAADLATIACCMPRLESLDLCGCSLPGNPAPPASASQPPSQLSAPVLDLQCFTELRGLRELRLGNVTVRASSLYGLTSLARLHGERVALTKWEHQSGARFGLPPQLRALRLSGSRPQSVEALEALEPLPSLTEVAVGDWQAPGDGGIGVVHMALAYPTSFRNSDGRLSPAGEEALCRAAALLSAAHTLVLDGPCSAGGDPRHLAGHGRWLSPWGANGLRGLGLGGFALDAADLATIARCMPGLESLDLSGCSLVAGPEPLACASQPPSQESTPGLDLQCLTALPSLQELRLGGATVRASSLAALTALTRLHAGCVALRVGEQQAGARFKLPPQLRALRLSSPQDVEDLAALEPLPSLTEVAVGPQAPGGGGIGVVRLSLALPTSVDAGGRLSRAGEEALCRAAALLSAAHELHFEGAARKDNLSLLLGFEGHGRWLSAWAANGLRGLVLGGVALTASDLATIARCMPGLESLDLSGCFLPDGLAPPASASQPPSQPSGPGLDLQCFADLPSLQELRLGGATVRASSLPGLTSVTRLHAGTLALTKWEHQSGARFGLPPLLRALRLSGSRPQSVEALAALEPLPSLTEVAVGDWQAPGDGGIGVVHMALAYPTSFDADGRLSPAGEEALCRAAAFLPGTRVLELYGARREGGGPVPLLLPPSEPAPGFEGHGLWLSAWGAKGLRGLTLGGFALSAADLATIARCMPRLESLDLSGCSLIDGPAPPASASQPPSQPRAPVLSLRFLAVLRGLQELRLGGTTVSASSLSGLTSLTRLHAGGVGRTASQVEAGARFGLPPQLRALRLSRPQAVEALAALEPLRGLTEVAVGPQAPGGGGIGVVRLSLALPTSVDAGGRLSRAGEEALCRAAALLSAAHELHFEGAARKDNLLLLLGFEGHGRWLSAWAANGLRKLGLGGFALDAADLATIARCMPGLESLDLSGCSLPDGPAPPASAFQPPSQASGPGLNLQCFADLPSLQELRLGGAIVGASSLSALTALTRLHAGGVGRTAEEVEAGARFGLPPQLRALRLSGPQSVEALAALEPLPSLTEVAVGAGSTPRDSDSGRVRLSLALPTSVDAGGRLSRAGEEALCRAAALLSGAHTLVLDGPWRKGDGPVPLLLPPLEPAPGFGGHGGWLSAFGANELGALMLVGVALSAADLATISSCMPGLEVLALKHCAFPAEALAALAALRNLASLVITWVPGAEVPHGADAAVEDLRTRTGPRLTVTVLQS